MSSFKYKTTVSRVLKKEGNEGNGYYTAKKALANFEVHSNHNLGPYAYLNQFWSL